MILLMLIIAIYAFPSLGWDGFSYLQLTYMGTLHFLFQKASYTLVIALFFSFAEIELTVTWLGSYWIFSCQIVLLMLRLGKVKTISVLVGVVDKVT